MQVDCGWKSPSYFSVASGFGEGIVLPSAACTFHHGPAEVDDDDGNDGEWSIHELIGNAVFSLANLNLLSGLWLWKDLQKPWP